MPPRRGRRAGGRSRLDRRAIDLALLRALRTRGHQPGVERAVLAFTRTGEHGLLWLVGCLVGTVVDRRRRPRYLRAIGTVVGAYLANIALKYVVRRRRPVVEGLPALSSTVTKLSFPSAHATTSFAAAWALTAGDGGLSRVPVYAVAKAMAASRVYVGVHYPSDIVAGAAFGTALAVLLGPDRKAQ
jgi:membrane-associated phospholipid phosphatase